MNTHMSEQINELAAALSKAQGEFPAIKKDKTATVTMKKGDYAGEKYTFDYADLATIIEATKPILCKYGLSFDALIEEEEAGRFLYCYLMHSSGQWKRSRLLIPREIPPQQVGTYMTYYRRYQESALLNLATEDDGDIDVPNAPPGFNKAATAPAAPKSKSGHPSDAQIKRLHTIASVAKWDPAQGKAFLKEVYGHESTTQLSLTEYDQFCNVMQSMSYTAAMEKFKQIQSDDMQSGSHP